MNLITTLLSLGHFEPTSSHLLQFPLKPHHKVVEERRRKLLEGSDGSNIAKQQIDSLFQGYGIHYIDLWVGTPPQRQTVIVGTGSSKTGFPCSQCYDCGELYHTDAYFEESMSSTYRKISTCNECKYGFCDQDKQECISHTNYVEGSAWYGVESIDTTYAGGPHSRLQPLPGSFNEKDADDADPLRAKNFAFNHTFVCIETTTGLFRTQMADGIMGMDNRPESFWRQAYDHQIIDKKVFALCLSRKADPTRQGTEAGALTMGGFDKRLHTSPMVYSKLDPSAEFTVNLRKIYLRAGGGGNSVQASDPNLYIEPLDVNEDVYAQYSEVLLDSGTTDTYLPIGFQDAFKSLWKQFSGRDYNHERMFITEQELNVNFPTILIQLDGNVELNSKLALDNSSNFPGLAGELDLDPKNPYDIIIAIPPSHYMQKDAYGSYVARFYVDERGFSSTFGANTMMGHDVLFDVEEGAIGFAESHCDYTQLEEEVAEEQGDGEVSEKEETKEETNVEKKPYVPKENLDNSNNAFPEENNGIKTDVGDKGLSVFGSISAAIAVAFFVGVGYVAYDRLGLRERLSRSHGRLSNVEDVGDLEFELQYVTPIV